MTLVSFAQNQEDILLWRALQHVSNGFYIDVGAADPFEWSVTKIFYDHGWHGINLEPQQAYFSRLAEARPHDINLSIAAGREAGQLIFHRIDNSGLSTFDTAIAEGHRAKGWDVVDESIELLPLSGICERYRPDGPIHFLKIDVEGSEGDVLAGADFVRFRPWIVLVEATLPMSQEASYDGWEGWLTNQGYSFVWFDGLNRYYLADEVKGELGRHFETPPNVFDGFTPAFHLLRRAERAEGDLQQTRDEAAQTVRAAEATSRQALEAMERLSEATTAAVRKSAHDAEVAGRRAAALQQEIQQQIQLQIQQQQEFAHTLMQTVQRTDALLVEQARRSEEVHGAARHAHEQLAMVLRSSSWRVTAPLRATRRLLSGGPRAVLRRVKELARRTFRLAVRMFLSLPGGRLSVRIAHALAPRLVDALARRYHAYEQGAAERRARNRAAFPVGGSPSAAALVVQAPEVTQSAAPANDLGGQSARARGVTQSPANEAPAANDWLDQSAGVLSEEELRLYRQFMSGRGTTD